MAKSKFDLQKAANRVANLLKKDPESLFVGTGLRRYAEKSQDKKVKALASVANIATGLLDPDRQAQELDKTSLDINQLFTEKPLSPEKKKQVIKDSIRRILFPNPFKYHFRNSFYPNNSKSLF